jgi:hypothetical protein
MYDKISIWNFVVSLINGGKIDFNTLIIRQNSNKVRRRYGGGTEDLKILSNAKERG